MPEGHVFVVSPARGQAQCVDRLIRKGLLEPMLEKTIA